MVDVTQDDFRQYLDRVDTLLHRFTGQKTSGNRPGIGGVDEMTVSRKAFEKGTKAATESLKFLHGSASDASYALQKVVGWGAFGIAVGGLISGLTDMGKTYSKLTDVGQSFGGSIFEMQKQAGLSGLTLEQFAQQITKNSTVIAQMGDAQTSGIEAFGSYQKAVRTSLKEFGYYGMTLSQVNEASGEFAESLRLSGQFGKMTDAQQSKASFEYIKNVNAMSHATGKSREEIMKLTNQVMRSPAVAATLSIMTPEQNKAFQTFNVGLAATMGDAGKVLAEMTAETMANQGQVWSTEMGKAAIDAGIGELNAPVQEFVEKINKNIAFSAADMGKIKNMKETIGEHMESLKTLRLDPQARAGVERWMKFYNDIQNYDPIKAEKAKQKADQERQDGITDAIMLFETNLNDITGAIRSGFYKGILGMLPDKGRFGGFQAMLDSAKDTLSGFAKALGSVVALFLQLLPTIESIFSWMVWGITGFKKVVTEILNLIPGMGPTYKKDEKGNIITHKENGVDVKEIESNLGSTVASVLTVGLTGLGYLLAKRLLFSRMTKMEAQIVYITAGKVIGPDGTLLAGGSPGGRKGIRERFTEGRKDGGGWRGGVRNVFRRGGAQPVPGQGSLDLTGGGAPKSSAFRTAGKAIAFTAVGYAVGQLLSAAIDQLPDSTTKTVVEKFVEYGAPLAGLIGSFTDLGSVAGTVLKSISGGWTTALETITPLITWAGSSLRVMAAAGLAQVAGMGSAIMAWWATVPSLGAAAGAAWAFTAALLANPITWVVVGITALIAAGVALYYKWDWVKTKFAGIFGWFGKQSDWVKTLIAAINPFANVTTKIHKAWDWVKQQFAGIFGWFSKQSGWVQGLLMAVAPFIFVPMKIYESWTPIKEFFVDLWKDVAWIFQKAWAPLQYTIDKMKDAWNWLHHPFGEDVPAAPGAAASGPPPSEQTQKIFLDAIPQLADIMKPMVFSDPSTEDNAKQVIKAMSMITPAMMAETMKRVEADPGHSFVSAPIRDDDTFETLNKRLLDLAALKGIDEQKRAQGAATKETLDEIKAIIKEQQLITNTLLHRGNTQRETANRDAANQRMMGNN